MPAAIGAVDQSCMTARPPFLARRPGAQNWIVRAIFPRAVQRAGAGGDDHVTRWRTSRTADSGDHVELVAVARDLRTFGREAFDGPIFRVAPWIVDVLDSAGERETIGAEFDAIATA